MTHGKDNMNDTRKKELMALSIGPSTVSVEGNYTNPRTFGVYRIPRTVRGSRQFRFGNHPIREWELIRDGNVSLEALFTDRSHAEELATILNLENKRLVTDNSDNYENLEAPPVSSSVMLKKTAMDRVSEVLDIVSRASKLGNYDSNVIGMAAEIIAEDKFKILRTDRGTKTIDGYWFSALTRRTVQVKAWSEARVKKYRSGTFFLISEEDAPDDLIVLLIYSSKPKYEVLYNGPARAIGQLEHSKKYGSRRKVRFDSLRSSAQIEKLLDEMDAAGNGQ